jgi:UDP-N-acetylmuramate-alanine ligase
MGVTLAALAGCSGIGAPASGADPNLAMLTTIYVDHMNAHQGDPPKNEAVFKDYIRQHGAHRLKGADTNELNTLFVSTRDNKPLVFVYGINADPRRQSIVIGYEQTAVDGKRTVGYRHGTVELIDDNRFVELAPAPAAAKR